jgi:hypothetical protein
MLLMPMFDLNELPSPNALQMKVIVKGKRLSESAGVEDHEDDHDDDSMSVTDESVRHLHAIFWEYTNIYCMLQTMSGAATLMNASKPRVTSDKRVLSPSSTVPHRVSKGDLSADLSDITFLGTGFRISALIMSLKFNGHVPTHDNTLTHSRIFPRSKLFSS